MCQRDEIEAVGLANGETVYVDRCIAPLVQALNMQGIPTVESCCGHGRLPPMVVLADGRDIRIMTGEQSAALNRLLLYGGAEPPAPDKP